MSNNCLYLDYTEIRTNIQLDQLFQNKKYTGDAILSAYDTVYIYYHPVNLRYFYLAKIDV